VHATSRGTRRSLPVLLNKCRLYAMMAMLCRMSSPLGDHMRLENCNTTVHFVGSSTHLLFPSTWLPAGPS
jgi:hypothetical protein